MNRIFTLTTPFGINKKDEIYSLFLKIGAKIIKEKYYNDSPIDLIAKLIGYIEDKDKNKSLFVERLKDIYIGKPIEVAIWEVPTKNILNLQKKNFESYNLDYIYHINDDSLCLYTLTKNEATKFGGIFFWQDCCQTTKFITDNKNLFKYIYLPVQLAKDGKGIFFEERIENRLMEIKLIRESDDIVTIIDRGGWENLQNLTARIDVKVKQKKKIYTETLLVTALIPMSPVKPEDLSKVIQQRKCFLNLLDIPTSVLEASEGLVYERLIPYSLGKYITNPQNKNIKKIIKETALIAAVLDSDCFNIANVKIQIDGLYKITDLIETSEYSSLDTKLNFIDALKTNGFSVFWTSFHRNLTEYSPKKFDSNIGKLLSVCHKDFHDYALLIYEKIRNECVNGDWLNRKLFDVVS